MSKLTSMIYIQSKFKQVELKNWKNQDLKQIELETKKNYLHTGVTQIAIILSVIIHYFGNSFG